MIVAVDISRRALLVIMVNNVDDNVQNVMLWYLLLARAAQMYCCL